MIGTVPKVILDSLGSGILAVDLDGRILYLNTKLSQYFRIDPQLWIGRSAPELFSSIESQASTKRLPLYRRASPRDPESKHSREVKWHDGNGIMHLREDSGPLRDDTGGLVGRLFAYHDL